MAATCASKPAGQEQPGGARADRGGVQSFEALLSNGSVVAALQLFAALFEETGLADSVDITVETKIVQQVSNFHCPTRLLLQAIQQELDEARGLGASMMGDGPLPAPPSAAPPQLQQLLTKVEASVKHATEVGEAAVAKFQNFDWIKLSAALGAIGDDALKALDKLEPVVKGLRPLVAAMQAVGDAAKALWSKAAVLKDDMAGLKDGKVSVMTFCKHLEATYAAAKHLGLALKGAAEAAKSLAVAAKALGEALKALAEVLKKSASQHYAALEVHLGAVTELHGAAQEAAKGVSLSHGPADELDKHLEGYAKSAGETALAALLDRIEGTFHSSSWEESLRQELIAGLASMVRGAVLSTASQAIAVARQLKGGDITQTVGFHFGSFLALQFVIVINMEKACSALAVQRA